LKQRHACTESANPLVVTLATPFVEVYPADFGKRPERVRTALRYALMGLQLFSMISLAYLFDLLVRLGLSQKQLDVAFWSFIAVSILSFLLIVWWGWVRQGATAIARQRRVQALSDATQLGDPTSSQRLLVIRAIDDEASLLLAFGTILNYLTTKLIVVLLFLLGLLFVVMNQPWAALGWKAFLLTGAGWTVLTILLLVMLMLSRSAHGRELAVSPMECQINTQSTPDATGLSRIVTLVRRTYVRSLRHRIYDQWACIRAISDWVHSQLRTVRSETRVVPGRDSPAG
jgi:hypothetical protein